MAPIQCQVRLAIYEAVIVCYGCVIYIYTIHLPTPYHTNNVPFCIITYVLHTHHTYIYIQAINLLLDLVKYLTSLRTLRMLRMLRTPLLPLYNKVDLDLIQLISILILIEGTLLSVILID